jgi:hypothetical protein
MAKKPPPPPPPPPKAKKAPPPPPPPPKAKKAPPPPAKKRSNPSKAKRGGLRSTKTRPARKTRVAARKAPTPKKKGRRIKIKLGLKQKFLSSDEDTYEDQVGWTVSQAVLEPLEDVEEIQKPEVVSHQCSMCGSIMQIPQPKRDRYKVICAYSECGHEDMIGI